MRREIWVLSFFFMHTVTVVSPVLAESDDEHFAAFKKDSFPATDVIVGMPSDRRERFLARCLEEEQPRDVQNQCLQIIESKQIASLLPVLEKIHRGGLGGGVEVLSTIRALDKNGATISGIILDDISGEVPKKKLAAASLYFQVFPASATANFLPVLDTPIKNTDDEHLVALSLLRIIEKGHDQYCTRLAKFKNSTDKKIKKILIRALGYCGGPKDIPALQKIYDEGKYGAGDAIVAARRIALRATKTKRERYAYLAKIASEFGDGYSSLSELALVTLEDEIRRGDRESLVALRSIAELQTGVGEIARKKLQRLEKEHGIK